jgi:FkbM family methyltransferase
MKLNAELERLRTGKRFSPGIARLNDMEIQYNDPLALFNEYQDIFIKEIYRFVPKTKRPVIFDVGGYLGLSTLFFSRNYPHAHITVFEPNPSIFQLLQTNISKNCRNQKNISLVNAAVGWKSGRAFLYTDGADGDSLLDNALGHPIEINVVQLSNYIKGAIDLIKMNIEGFEKDVLEEIESKLSFIRELIIEYHAFFNWPQNLGEILCLLNRERFRYIVAECPSARVRIPFELAPNYRYFSLIYARNQAHA